MTLPAFPDAEIVVMTALEGLAPTVTETPDPIELPVIKVNRAGGTSSLFQDHPRMELTCYGSTRHEAWELAQQAEQELMNRRGGAVAGTVIDQIVVDNPPQLIVYDNPDVRRVLLYVRCTWRRQAVFDQGES